jgi:putative ABC transport system permease protein
MRKIHLVRRQLAGSLHQAAIFVLCVVLSLLTLVSLSGFSQSVHSSFLKDARALHAADIIVHAHSPFSEPLLRQLTILEKQQTIASARVHEFYSIVRTTGGDASLLSNLKVVGPGYPFYGSVQLASGRPFGEILTSGNIIVEQALLDRLHLRIGDRVRIGKAAFTIRDVVLLEPDQPINFFSLGPRVFIPDSDLVSLDLVGKGSRVNYTILVKVMDQKDLDKIALELKAASLPDRERIETYRTADSGVKRFFDNFLFFLNLIGIFTLLLAGIGIQSSLTAFLKEQERTIAIMKAVGAGSPFIIRNYFALVSVLGLFGTALGIGASFLLEQLLPGLFQGLLPANIELAISPAAIVEGVVLGCVVVVLFTIIPLLRLKDVKPRAIFGKTEGEGRNRYTWLLAGAIAVFFSLMVLWRLKEVKTGIYYVLGTASLILVSLLVAEAILRLLRTLRPGNLVLRQALKGLFRPRNATRAIMVTLSAALAVIFSITLVEKNLDATFVSSYPPDSPNVFFIDIQQSQKKAFANELGMPAIFYPLVRGTVMSINDVAIDREQEQKKRGDNLGREFNLTYRDNLLDDERIIAGNSLYQKDWQGPQVSVLDTVVKMHEMKVSDRITFRIQGLPVEARISSIRTRTKASLQPFFYFVFPREVLQDAPQTLFTALRVQKERVALLQNRIVTAFPNVSVIDVTETIAAFSKIMARLSTIVNFFTLFSVVAGILIIVSSVFATRYTRIQEAVFYTILGARGRFVLAVFGMEGLLIGFASAASALAIAQTTSWIVCTYAFEVAFQPFLATSLIMALATMLMVVVVGLGAAVPILRHKPAAFLREQAEE